MDFLADYYSLIKALHVISIIAWMAGLLYLPRLYVNHAQHLDDDKLHEVFLGMEFRLIKIIMAPAMVASWSFGIMLLAIPGVIDWSSDFWFHAKFTCLILLTIVHFYLAIERKKFVNRENVKSHKSYRILNEIPTLLMIIIVVMVIMRPF